MKKALITHGWSDLNKGDSAIVIGMINALKRVLDDDCQYIHVSEFAPKDERIDTSYVHLLTAHPDLKMLGSVLPILPIINCDKKTSNFFTIIWYLLRSMIYITFYPLFGDLMNFMFNKPEKETLKAYKESDIIYSKGGGFIFTQKGFRSFIRLYRVLYPIILGIIYKKPVHIYAQSIGPLSNKLDRWLVKAILSKCKKILVRENISKELLEEIGVTSDIEVVPDAAFLLQDHLTDKVKKYLNEFGNHGNIAVTVRQWSFKDKDGYHNYLKSIATVVDYFVENCDVKAILVPQVIGPNKFEDDRYASRELYKFIQSKSNVLLIDEDFSPQELKALYSKCDLLIGTRFHSVILATSCGVPSLALGYLGPKTDGIMQQLGLGKYVFHVESVTSSELLTLSKDLWENRKNIQKELDLVISKITEEAIHTAKMTIGD